LRDSRNPQARRETMKIERTRKAGIEGKGIVMFGRKTTGDQTSKWFERWFETFEKAEAFAAKKGWTVETA